MSNVCVTASENTKIGHMEVITQFPCLPTSVPPCSPSSPRMGHGGHGDSATATVNATLCTFPDLCISGIMAANRYFYLLPP